MAAGLGHCLGLLDGGALLAWGWNGGGQCGLGDLVSEECVPLPTPVHGAPPSR